MSSGFTIGEDGEKWGDWEDCGLERNSALVWSEEGISNEVVGGGENPNRSCSEQQIDVSRHVRGGTLMGRDWLVEPDGPGDMVKLSVPTAVISAPIKPPVDPFGDTAFLRSMRASISGCSRRK